jgi:hypothetical protein
MFLHIYLVLITKNTIFIIKKELNNIFCYAISKSMSFPISYKKLGVYLLSFSNGFQNLDPKI